MPDIKAQALSFAESLSALGDAEEKLKSFNQAIEESQKRLADARAEEAANAERVAADKAEIVKNRREAAATLERAQKVYSEKLDEASSQAKQMVDEANAKAKAAVDAVKGEIAELKTQAQVARDEAKVAIEARGKTRDELAKVRKEAADLARRLSS